jgi:hypothetical protein
MLDWLSTPAKNDLNLLFAFLAAVFAASPVVGWAIGKWNTRLTVSYLTRSRDLVLERCVSEQQRISIRVTVRTRGLPHAGFLLQAIDIAFVDAPTFPPFRFRAAKRLPTSTVRIIEVSEFDEGPGPSSSGNREGGAVIAYRDRGRRPFRVDVLFVADKPFAGYISVRENTTDRVGRVPIGIV